MTNQDLYNLLKRVPNGVLLRVGDIGTKGNLCLDFMVDGEATGVCPLVEMTPQGTLVAQVTDDGLDPIRALKDTMGIPYA